jgi:hypothetical protein
MKTFSETLDVLNHRFWNEVHPHIRERAELDQIEMGQFVFNETSQLTGFDYPPRLIEKSRFLTDRAVELVREELFAQSHMHFSCPTRFALMYFDSLVRHFEEVKRRYMAAGSPDHRRDLFGNYDVERDIAMTAKKIAEFKEGHLQTERHYL